MNASSVTSDGILWFEKDKDAKLNYSFKLDEVLSAEDALASLSWTVAPSGLTIEDVSFSGKNVTAVFDGGAAKTWYAVKFHFTTVAGLSDDFVVRVFCTQDAETIPVMGTALFPNRFSATSALRRDRLLAAAAVLPNASFTDDYLWDKLRAAEAETQRELRVFFQPTALFPQDPTDLELAALNGAPWAIDPGYDFGPAEFLEDKWGMVVVRQKPIISVSSVKMVYPSPQPVTFDFPLDWLRMDKKYGNIRIVPTSVMSLQALSASVIQLFSARSLPHALQVRYVAGLSNPQADYPELIDAVMKRAVLKAIGDQFLPQSGSISADGLSQSMSIDMSKYHDSVDVIINGPKGSNGGLMTAIHGIRASSLG